MTSLNATVTADVKRPSDCILNKNLRLEKTDVQEKEPIIGVNDR